MVKIEGAEKVYEALRKLHEQTAQDAKSVVVVGFTQNYAVYVHENLEAYHHVGQAKFLETPLRVNRNDIATVITLGVQRTKSVLKGLLLGGLRLQREAQKLCPVDTGALKNSAFTCDERELTQAAQRAKAMSDRMRASKLEGRHAKALEKAWKKDIKRSKVRRKGKK